MTLSKTKLAFIGATLTTLSACASNTRIVNDDNLTYNGSQQYNTPLQESYNYSSRRNRSHRHNSGYYYISPLIFNTHGPYHRNSICLSFGEAQGCARSRRNHWFGGHRNSRHIWEQSIYVNQAEKNSTQDTQKPGTYTAPIEELKNTQ